MRPWPWDPVRSAVVVTAGAYFLARLFKASRPAASAWAVGAFITHDRYVDRDWPFKRG